MLLLINFKIPIIAHVSSVQLYNQVSHNLRPILYLKCSNSHKWASETKSACCLPTTFISKTEFPFVNVMHAHIHTTDITSTWAGWLQTWGQRIISLQILVWCPARKGKNTNLLSDLLRKNRLCYLFQYSSVVFQAINWIILVKIKTIYYTDEVLIPSWGSFLVLHKALDDEITILEIVCFLCFQDASCLFTLWHRCPPHRHFLMGGQGNQTVKIT